MLLKEKFSQEVKEVSTTVECKLRLECDSPLYQAAMQGYFNLLSTIEQKS